MGNLCSTCFIVKCHIQCRGHISILNQGSNISFSYAFKHSFVLLIGREICKCLSHNRGQLFTIKLTCFRNTLTNSFNQVVYLGITFSTASQVFNQRTQNIRFTFIHYRQHCLRVSLYPSIIKDICNYGCSGCCCFYHLAFSGITHLRCFSTQRFGLTAQMVHYPIISLAHSTKSHRLCTSNNPVL